MATVPSGTGLSCSRCSTSRDNGHTVKPLSRRNSICRSNTAGDTLVAAGVRSETWWYCRTTPWPAACAAADNRKLTRMNNMVPRMDDRLVKRVINLIGYRLFCRGNSCAGPEYQQATLTEKQVFS